MAARNPATRTTLSKEAESDARLAELVADTIECDAAMTGHLSAEDVALFDKLEVERTGGVGVVRTAFDPVPRPTHILPPPPRHATWASDRVIGAARIRLEGEGNALLQRPDHAVQACIAHADRLEAEATGEIPAGALQTGAGGELVPMGNAVTAPAPYRNTVEAPSYITAEASRSRLDLANDCGVLSQTLDICDTIGAQNSLERMLAGQMAQLHKVTMKAGQRAAEAYEQANGAIDQKYREACSVRGQRETNAACRASDAFQGAMLTIQKLRSGGKQNITVTHIQNTQVNSGGQAVVTSGPVATPGAGPKQDGGAV